MPPAGRHVFIVIINPRDAAVSFQCARAAGTPDLLFIIYYLLFLTCPPPACIKNPFYRTLSAPFPPGFVQSGQNAHFTPKNMCNILRKTPLRTGSFFGTIKLCKSAFLQVRPEQNLGKCAKERGPVRVAPHGMQITLMKTEEEKCPEQNSLWMATPRLRM